VKSTPSPQDEEIIELLKSLGTLKAEYPAELLAARRAAFTAQIEQRRANGASKEEYLSQDRMIELLESLKPVAAEYPADLLAARRAAFIAQIQQHNGADVEVESPSQDQVIELLGNLKSGGAKYPPELLAARRAAFIGQIQQHNGADARQKSPSRNQMVELLGHLKSTGAEYPSEQLAARRAAFIGQIRQRNAVGAREELLPSPNGKIGKLFERLKSMEIEYPLKMWSARRSVFVAQIRESKVSVLDALRSVLHNLFNGKSKPTMAPAMSFRRMSMVVATLLVVAFMGSLAYGNRQPITQIFAPSSSQGQVVQPSPVAAVTGTGEVAQVICKPGYLPPLCLAKEFDQSQDLTFPGNGSARPAVAKDTIPGHSKIHKAAYVNDGLYGPGASWISNSAYSWIKIDLGEARIINTITFGRDRLGNFNDGDPGQFIVAVALADDIYADGNSSNDYTEYTQVYNSDEAGFDGIVTGPETVEARFDPVNARYVKITFENARTAVDEIEVFMIQPREFASHMTQRPKDTAVPATFTPIPTNTLIPSKTPTLIPTNTLFPTFTSTPRPTFTSTPRPTFTFTPPPTNTEVPTDTPEPPTDTPPPPPTDTPEPPTDTPEPPPTDTPPPPPTETPEPPTATSEPQLASTETPEGTIGP
jgi:hypothetical protein